MNTTTNTTTATTPIPELVYDASLMTKNEQRVIVNSNGLAVLKHVDELDVIVHDGPFHADEIMAILLLEDLDIDVHVIRSRNDNELNSADVRVDVGEGLLDHHGNRMEAGVSAATRVLALVLQTMKAWNWKISDYQRMKITEAIQQVATVDTGAECPNMWSSLAQLHNRYSLVSGGDPWDYSNEFNSALAQMKQLWVQQQYIWMREDEAAACAAEVIGNANQRGDKVVTFSKEARVADVKRMLYDTKSSAVFYVSPESADDWRILCAANPEQEFSYFNSWKLIPEKYRGLRGLDLDKASGLKGGIFVHKAGFIGGFERLAAAQDFAHKCLDE